MALTILKNHVMHLSGVDM